MAGKYSSTGATSAIREMIADGEWHSIEEAIAAVWPLIRPEVLARVQLKRNFQSEYAALRQLTVNYIGFLAVEKRFEGRRVVAIRIQP